jgi:hypothetical protein
MNVERRLGSFITFALYFFSGFAALALFLVFNRDFDAPLVGASGAVSGIVGMYLVLFRSRTVEVMWFAFVVGGIVRVKAVAVAALWIGLELLQAVLLNEKVMVAHWAHVGGFAGGAVLTILILKVYRGYPEVYATETKRRTRDRFEEMNYIPDVSAPARAEGLSVIAREWRPLSGLIRRIVDGVAPGSGAFSRPSRLAGGLALPQAEDLRSRLDRAGYPAAVQSPSADAADVPIVFLDRLDIAPDGLEGRDQQGAPRTLESKRIDRVQAGTVRGTLILDVVAGGLRFRLSGATASVPVADVVASIRKVRPVEEADRPFHSLGELDEYFRWRLQRAG